MNTLLPIFNLKETIVEAVKNSVATIITAETGSGKSTQVPQYLNEAGYDVVVTEPRRMAAWSLAERVAEEMNTTIGDKVGFRTRFERKCSSNTSILYCTDGLELVRTLTDKQQHNKQSVLIIDEAHEWNLNIETLIAWVKKKISEGWNTKVVIMSATLERKNLSAYLGKGNCLIEAPGKLFPVSFTQKCEHELIPSIREMILEGRNTLVFVPGKKEMDEVIAEISNMEAVILPLHGELDSIEQKKCFESYTLPKVVVATNVAQTSITIPDIDAVVDTGKERRLEVHDGIQGLFLRDISQADCMQRKGRAGRTKDGIYILCSNTPLEARDKFSVPEIQRGILDQIVLRLATCGIDATELEFFHQPSEEALKRAKETLISLGAFTDNGDVTQIGYKMAKMPVSVQSARMIVEAEKYGVTDEVISIASILEIGSMLKRDTYYFEFTSEESSDLLAELDAWNKLNSMKFIEFDKLGINKKTFYRIKEHIQKMHQSLEGLVKMTSSRDRNNIKKACLVGMLDNVYRQEDGRYINGDGTFKNLDRKSSLKGIFYPRLIVGKPKTIEFKDRWGYNQTMDLITMATKVSVEDLQEIAPQFITYEDENPYYSCSSDCIMVTRKTCFKGNEIERKDVAIQNHPDYEKLKEEYQSNIYNYYDTPRKQETVTIDGKIFEVYHSYYGPCIEIDLYTLYHTEVKNVFLDDGSRVILKYGSVYSEGKVYNMTSLRNRVENNRISEEWKKKKRNLPELKSFNIKSVLDIIPYLGKKEITRGNGGYGDPIYGFVCLSLTKKSSLQVELLEDEEKAKTKTQETVEVLYGKIIKEKYSEKKFKFLKGVKGLSPKEQKVKAEFDAEVRELLNGLDISNIEERLFYLEELYQVIIEDLQIVA